MAGVANIIAITPIVIAIFLLNSLEGIIMQSIVYIKPLIAATAAIVIETFKYTSKFSI
jgi:hypothetical protein